MSGMLRRMWARGRAAACRRWIGKATENQNTWRMVRMIIGILSVGFTRITATFDMCYKGCGDIVFVVSVYGAI